MVAIAADAELRLSVKKDPGKAYDTTFTAFKSGCQSRGMSNKRVVSTALSQTAPLHMHMDQAGFVNLVHMHVQEGLFD